jgi:hypothetical protein
MPQPANRNNRANRAKQPPDRKNSGFSFVNLRRTAPEILRQGFGVLSVILMKKNPMLNGSRIETAAKITDSPMFPPTIPLFRSFVSFAFFFGLPPELCFSTEKTATRTRKRSKPPHFFQP